MGAMSQLNKSIENNRKLLRKKNRFKKERRFMFIDPTSYKWKTFKLSSKKVSPAVLSQIQLEAEYIKRKEQIVISLAILISMATVLYFVYTVYKSDQAYMATVDNKIELTKDQKLYRKYMKKGDGWLREDKFNAAIYYYDKAQAIYPNDYDIEYKILYTYCLQCKKEKTNCKKATELIDSVYKAHPEKIEDMVNLKEEMALR